MTELGAVLLSTVGLVPDGMVVFLPSYSFLDKVKAFWGQSGLTAKLADRKEVSGTSTTLVSELTQVRFSMSLKLQETLRVFFETMLLLYRRYDPPGSKNP